MGENPAEIAHKFGAQKKRVDVDSSTARNRFSPPPALTPIWRESEGERERGGGEYGLHMMFTRQRLLAHINY